MRILVTGTNGFIGKNLIRTFAQNEEDELILLTNHPVEGFTCVPYLSHCVNKSVFQEMGVESIDCVIHLGAFTPKCGAEANDVGKSNSNIVSTNNLFNNLPNAPSRFVFISTLDVYGITEEVITEDTPVNPINMYALSKLYCERMLRVLCENQGIELRVLRLGHIYGTGEEAYKKVIPVMMEALLNGDVPHIYSDGSEKRAFLNVVDCCNFIIRAAHVRELPGVVNIVSGNSITILDLAKLIISISDMEAKPKVLDANMRVHGTLFNASVRESYLGQEQIDLRMGLSEEYNYLSKIIPSQDNL